jgi:hypothetical protein
MKQAYNNSKAVTTNTLTMIQFVYDVQHIILTSGKIFDLKQTFPLPHIIHSYRPHACKYGYISVSIAMPVVQAGVSDIIYYF